MLIAIIFCAAAFVRAYIYRRFLLGTYMPVGTMPVPASIRTAAKRLGHCAQPAVHSIASVHSPELCVFAMAIVFARRNKRKELPDTVLIASSQKGLHMSDAEASDIAILAPRPVAQGGGATPSFQHLTKRLKQLNHGPAFDKLIRVLDDVTATGTKGMQRRAQADVLGALVPNFRTA